MKSEYDELVERLFVFITEENKRKGYLFRYKKRNYMIDRHFQRNLLMEEIEKDFPHEWDGRLNIFKDKTNAEMEDKTQ